MKKSKNKILTIISIFLFVVFFGTTNIYATENEAKKESVLNIDIKEDVYKTSESTLDKLPYIIFSTDRIIMDKDDNKLGLLFSAKDIEVNNKQEAVQILLSNGAVRINAPVENKVNITREYATLDLFPTTLAALGAEIEGNRLGLGTNLFSSDQTLTERFGIDQINKELRKKSKMMEELADIDKDSKALMIREGRVPKATITAGEYQRETGLIPVSVTNIENVTNGIQSVQMIVWTKADQSDQQWIPMGINEDGTYTANINVMSYGFYEGEYQIYVYVVDGNGEQSVLGTAVGIVN